jgi:hypothetical protein
MGARVVGHNDAHFAGLVEVSECAELMNPEFPILSDDPVGHESGSIDQIGNRVEIPDHIADKE